MIPLRNHRRREGNTGAPAQAGRQPCRSRAALVMNPMSQAGKGYISSFRRCSASRIGDGTSGRNKVDRAWLGHGQAFALCLGKQFLLALHHPVAQRDKIDIRLAALSEHAL